MMLQHHDYLWLFCFYCLGLCMWSWMLKHYGQKWLFRLWGLAYGESNLVNSSMCGKCITDMLKTSLVSATTSGWKGRRRLLDTDVWTKCFWRCFSSDHNDVEVVVSFTAIKRWWQYWTCVASKLRAFILEYVRNSKSSVSCVGLLYP